MGTHDQNNRIRFGFFCSVRIGYEKSLWLASILQPLHRSDSSVREGKKDALLISPVVMATEGH